MMGRTREPYQRRNPTYIGVTVCEEWKDFRTFEKWMLKQKYEGMVLDKDIRVKGNKIYSPETCIFVPYYVNNLFKTSPKSKYPKGVSFHKHSKRLRATIGIKGKSTHLGYFDTVKEASEAYITARNKVIKEIQNDKVRY